MSLLTRDQILGADDRRTQDVPVPEWGGTVRVRSLSGSERDSYESGIVQHRSDGSKKVNLVNIRARLVALTACGEDNERIFSEDDVVELGKKSAAALERVFDVSRHLSGLTEDDVEELAEGLGPAPSDASTSD